MNRTTPRVFIAATRQNDGKTTTSVGLMASLQKHFKRVGYIKPVGQRYAQVAEHKIDEDALLVDTIYQTGSALTDLSPIAVDPAFTRNYLRAPDADALIQRITDAFDRVAAHHDFVLCEGSGHAGVGSVFDLSNAQVARALGAKAIIVSQGGIGRPIDEVALNQALFEREGVEIIGVVLNKVRAEKIPEITEFATRGLERRGLRLLGVLPYQAALAQPTVDHVRAELGAEVLNRPPTLQTLVERVVVGAMAAQNAMNFFQRGALLLTPGDREDMLLAAGASTLPGSPANLAGIVLTGGLRPGAAVLKAAQSLPLPVLLAQPDTYQVAARISQMSVKTRAGDLAKIALIRELALRLVDIRPILHNL